MSLHAGQEALLINDQIWIVDQGKLVEMIDLPNETTASRFVEKEAGKCGLAVVPRGYSLVIRRKSLLEVFLQWLY
jgi:hypothetical protein